jgi:hypothetical protein
MREAIRREGQRYITARSGEETERLSMMEAMIRALGTMGLKSGVLAKIKFIELLREEEELSLRERQAEFTKWENYARDKRKSIARSGSTENPFAATPHPDDIILDRENLTVRLVGPRTTEEAAQASCLCDVRDLLIELMIFYGEEIGDWSRNRGDILVGVLGATYFQLLTQLPPRLWAISDEVVRKIEARLLLKRQAWEELLRADCAKLGIHFARARKRLETWRIGDLAARLSGDDARVMRAWLRE